MVPASKKVAVVGGGIAGISAVAMLLEEGGFEPVCFEKTDRPGGTWCYREESLEGVGAVMPTTVLNHSKEMGAISNYPPKKECSVFMRHGEMHAYFLDYARDRSVLKHFRYNTEVTGVARAEDYLDTGRWVVKARDATTGRDTEEIFDGVLVCVGHLSRPKVVTYPGLDGFRGRVSHTHTLRGVERFKDKSVAVVGMGCSGLDAAVGASNVAKQVYLSTRSGAHVMNRVGPRGYPYDYLLMRRFAAMLLDLLPFHWTGRLIECVYTDRLFDQRLYRVRPKHHILAKDPVINDHLASKLLSGGIIQKPDIERFVEDGVVFEGDSDATPVDEVVMATGYTWAFPFLEEGVIAREGVRLDLYKNTFPAHLEHGTLALIAFILPFGPGIPAGELQARWAVRVLSGKCRLPPGPEMREDVRRRHRKNLSRYGPGDKVHLRVEIVQFCDELAAQIGARPDLWRILMSDPVLWCRLVFGPCLSYQYRLQGPHPWEGARDAIFTCQDRLFYPLTKRQKERSGRNMLMQLVAKLFRLLFYSNRATDTA